MGARKAVSQELKEATDRQGGIHSWIAERICESCDPRIEDFVIRFKRSSCENSVPQEAIKTDRTLVDSCEDLEAL